MTRKELHDLIYDEVKADVETEAEATNPFQEGYAVGFNDCRARVLSALAKRLSLGEDRIG